MALALAIFGAIAGVAKALPVLDSWLQRFIVWYTENKLGAMKAENRDAIITAVKTHDQRPIEHVIESPTAGKPSGIPGSTFVPGPPPRE